MVLILFLLSCHWGSLGRNLIRSRSLIIKVTTVPAFCRIWWKIIILFKQNFSFHSHSGFIRFIRNWWIWVTKLVFYLNYVRFGTECVSAPNRTHRVFVASQLNVACWRILEVFGLNLSLDERKLWRKFYLINYEHLRHLKRFSIW